MPTLDANTWGNSDPSIGSKEDSFAIPDHVPGAAQFRARQEFAATTAGSAPFARKLVGTQATHTHRSPMGNNRTSKEFTPLLRSVKKTLPRQKQYSPTTARFRGTNNNNGRLDPLLSYDEMSYSSNSFDNMSGIKRHSLTPKSTRKGATRGLNELLTEGMPLREQETRMKELSNENTKLKIDLLQARQELQRNTPAHLKETREELVQLRSDNMRLTTQVEHMTVELEEREQELAEKDELLQKRDASNRSIQDNGMEAELERLQGQVADTEYEANRRQEDLDDALDEIDALKARLESIEREREQEAYDKSADKSMDRSMRDRSMDTSTRSRFNCTLDHNDARNELDGMKYDIDQLEAELRQKDAEMDEAQVIIQKLSSELSAKREMEQNHDKFSTTEAALRRQIDEYAHHVEQLKEEKEHAISTLHAELDAHVRKLEHDHAVEQDRVKVEVERIQGELGLRERQIMDLEGQVNHMKANLESVPLEMEPLRSEISRLEHEKVNLEGVIEELRMLQSHNSQRDEERQRLASQRDDLMQRLALAESDRDHYRDDLQKRAQYWTHERQRLETQRDDMQDQLDRMDRKHSPDSPAQTHSRGYAAIVQQEQEKLRIYKLQSEDIQSKMQNLIDSQYDDLKKQSSEFNQVNAELARLSSVDSKLRELGDDLALMEQHLDAEQKRRAHSEERGQVLERQIRDAEERMRQMSSKPQRHNGHGEESFIAINYSLQEQNQDLRNRLDAETREANSYRLKLEHATRLQKGAEKNADFLEKRVMELENSINELRVHIAKIEQERDSLIGRQDDQASQSSLEYALCLLSEKEQEIAEIRGNYSNQKKKLVAYIHTLRSARRQSRAELVPLQKLNEALERELREKEEALEKTVHHKERSEKSSQDKSSKLNHDIERLVTELRKVREEKVLIEGDMARAMHDRDSYAQKLRDSQKAHEAEVREQTEAFQKFTLKDPYKDPSKSSRGVQDGRHSQENSYGSPRHGFRPGPRGSFEDDDDPYHESSDDARKESRGHSSRDQQNHLKHGSDVEFLESELAIFENGIRYEMYKNQYLLLKLERSQQLRANLGVQKIYYEAMIAELRFCNKADLKVLESMGITPKSRAKKTTRTLGGVARMVLATVRLQRLGKGFAEVERQKQRLLALASEHKQ